MNARALTRAGTFHSPWRRTSEMRARKRFSTGTELGVATAYIGSGVVDIEAGARVGSPRIRPRNSSSDAAR